MSVASEVFAARVINSVTVDGGSVTNVTAGSTVVVEVTVTTSGSGANNDWQSTSYMLDGVTTCVNTSNFNSPGTYTDNFNITVPSVNGTYDISVYAHRRGNCSPGTDSNNFVLTDSIVVGTVIPPGSSDCGTFLDTFSSNSFNNSNGSLDWSGESWLSANVNNGAIIDINGNRLRLRGNDTSSPGNETTMSRALDLTGYSTATLSFDYDTSTGVDGDDDIFVEISSDGGASFSELELFEGEVDGSASYDISGYISSGVVIRYRFAPYGNQGSCCYGANGEYFYVDNVEVEACSPAVLEPVAKWRLDEGSWSGTANEVLDESSNALHGRAISVNNLPTPESEFPAIDDPDGTCGYGVFDGPNRGYVRIDDPGNNSILDLRTELTVSTWIWPRSIPSSGLRTIVSKDENFEFHVNTSGQIFWWWGGGSRQLTTSGTPLVANQADGDGTPLWYHVTITYTSGEQKIYINGVERASRSVSGNLTLNNDPVLIGTDLNFNSRTFDGYIDEVNIFDSALTQAQVQQLMAETHPCPVSGVDHYAISFDGGVTFSDANGLTCQPEAVTITAHDASHNPVVPGEISIALSTNTGEGVWSLPVGQDGSLVNNGSGDADYTFDTSNDSVTLNLTHTTAATVNVTIGTGEEQEDPNITFVDTGFRFVDVSDNEIGGPDNLFHQFAGVPSSDFYLQAVRRDTDTGSCVGVFADGEDVSVELGVECNNPSTCAGISADITNNSNTVSLATVDDNGGSGSSSYTLISNLRFGSDSKAALSIEYEDVGAVSIHARHEILDGDGIGTGTYMMGSSNSVVFRPADIVITDVTGNPAGVSSFLRAGDSFEVFVEAREAGGNRTPNFGREATPETVSLNFDNLILPSGGSDGFLSPGAYLLTATAGRLSANDNVWNEVGTFTATASIADGDYLGAGGDMLPNDSAADDHGSVSENIGRFYPAAYQLSGGTSQNSCDVFSYMGDSSIVFGGELQALNLFDDVVLNYDTPLGFPTADTSQLSAVAEDNDNGTDLSTRASVVMQTEDWVQGVYDLSGFRVNFARGTSVAERGPYTQLQLGLQIVDTDGSTFTDEALDMDASLAGSCEPSSCTAAAVGGTLNLRHGRLFTQDAHGPETAPLKVPFQTEYWSGSQWLLNVDDSCTQIPQTAIEFDSESVSIDVDVNVDGSGSDDTSGAFVSFGGSTVSMENGDAGLVFSSPNVMGSFPVSVDLSNHEWLQFDWNQDGIHDDSSVPDATVSFGSYRGHDRIIYWQEQLP